MAVLWGVDAPKAGAVGYAWRPAAVRDRAAAALHRGGAVRGDCVSHDEPGDDLGAARHEDVRLTVSDSNFGIQWHIVAMYGPSFFTGSLIARFGAPRIVALGLLLEAARQASAFPGITALHFWATLIVLGVGWNFALSAPRRWCWRRIGRRNATRCRPSTISWCSG
jgi:hypothetical protein